MNPRSALPAAIGLGVMIGFAIGALNTPVTASATPALRPALSGVTDAPPVWDLPVVRNDAVQRFVDLFHHSQPDRMALYLKRSGRYEGMIRGKLREHGMPEDLLYLSMIESGFNPEARSTAAAVGLWQFMADTGRRYGLRIDSYVDERRDPVRSTDAALRYLRDLHNRFGSWSLATAAYNTGENRVARIMEEETGAVRGMEGDFWRIRSRLPNETREYVPLMFAAALIGKEPGKYGLEQVERLLPTPVDEVTVAGGTSLAELSTLLEVPAAHLRRLNPHLVQGMTPPGEPYPVYIPAGRGNELIRPLTMQRPGAALGHVRTR